MEASLLYPSKCILAEGPYWHAKWNSFLWVDIEKGTLYRYDWAKKKVKTWDFPHRLSLVLEGKGDGLILALDARLARFDPDTENLTWLVDIETEKPLNRCNDGACDASGRLWVGTMSTQFDKNAGALYCVDTDFTLTKKVASVTISNGIAWSLDHKTMYYIDTPTKSVQAFGYEVKTGDISYIKEAITIPEGMGSPDGMCLDEKGHLWIAHYGGSGVYCWDPGSGKLLDKIEVPAPHVTSCAFGGSEGNQLLITTARENMIDAQLEEFPDSGSVFAVPMPVKGSPVYGCAF
ncbi:SMP-30/gluconolactonase/LRE family protein [Negadavirga shengliensis]|uniref:SMP-30/gluconolactonase/LRE family protein n=1 Tax=Negadavirga shengliensis TaxID=1389218 RepID=A0ABV9SZR1_9BACT